MSERTAIKGKRTKGSFRGSRKELDAFIDSIPTAVMVYQDDRWISVNSAAEIATSYSAEELLAMNYWDIVNPDQRDAARERGLKRQLGDATKNHYELKIITKDGMEKWMDVTSASIIIGSRPAGVVSVADVTARKRAETALKTSEERLRSFFDNAVEGVYRTTLDGRLAYANIAYARMLGYESPQEAIDNATDIANQFYTDPDDRRKIVNSLTEKGRLDNFECQMRRKDGTTFWAVINARLAYLQDNIPCIEGFVADATLRKQAEIALWETQERFRAFMDNSPVIAWAKDDQGRYIYLNQTYENRFGVRLDDWFGKTDFELWPADIAEPFWKNDQQVLLSNGLVQIEEETYNPDGSCCKWWNFKFPIEDVTGRRYVGGIGLDITERKHYEEKIEELNKELEQRIVELKKVNRELEVLNYSVSHDLRTPLVVLSGFARILTDKHSHLLDEKGKHYLDIVNKSSKRMTELIEDLLAFFGLGQKTICHKTTDMKRLVSDIVVDFKTAFPDQNFQVNVKPLPFARGDRKMLRQVLVNLIDNAIKYSKPKELAVIEVGGRAGEGKNIYYVKDNGIGFSRDQADNIFEVFARLNSTDEFRGTGIGLAIVKKIVEKHGGEVWAEARPGAGATFYFSLPEEISVSLS